MWLVYSNIIPKVKIETSATWNLVLDWHCFRARLRLSCAYFWWICSWASSFHPQSGGSKRRRPLTLSAFSLSENRDFHILFSTFWSEYVPIERDWNRTQFDFKSTNRIFRSPTRFRTRAAAGTKKTRSNVIWTLINFGIYFWTWRKTRIVRHGKTSEYRSEIARSQNAKAKKWLEYMFAKVDISRLQKRI